MYSAIDILQKHTNFLIDRHTRLSESGSKPEDPDSLFSTQWTRTAVASVVAKGAGHLTEVSHVCGYFHLVF